MNKLGGIYITHHSLAYMGSESYNFTVMIEAYSMYEYMNYINDLEVIYTRLCGRGDRIKDAGTESYLVIL